MYEEITRLDLEARAKANEKIGLHTTEYAARKRQPERYE
jgi:hypothetical protein